MKDKPVPGLCPRFHAAVELLGRRWTGAILYLLAQQASGFAGLRDAIPGITDRMLSERLRELETEDVVARTVLGGAPVRVQYALTDKGRSLGHVLRAIGDWSHEWLPEDARPSGPHALKAAPAARRPAGDVARRAGARPRSASGSAAAGSPRARAFARARGPRREGATAPRAPRAPRPR